MELTNRGALLIMGIICAAFVADAIYLRYLPMALPAVVIIATAGIGSWVLRKR